MTINFGEFLEMQLQYRKLISLHDPEDHLYGVNWQGRKKSDFRRSTICCCGTQALRNRIAIFKEAIAKQNASKGTPEAKELCKPGKECKEVIFEVIMCEHCKLKRTFRFMEGRCPRLSYSLPYRSVDSFNEDTDQTKYLESGTHNPR